MRTIRYAAILALGALALPAFSEGQPADTLKSALQSNYNRISKSMVAKQIGDLYRQIKSMATPHFHYTMQTGKRLDLSAFLKSVGKGVADARQSGRVTTRVGAVTFTLGTIKVKGLMHVSMQVADSFVPSKTHIFDSYETRQDTWKYVDGKWKLDEMKVLKTSHFIDHVPTVSALL